MKKADQTKIFGREEIEACILRFILSKCQANNEFDFMLFIKEPKCMLQFEVKAFSANDANMQKETLQTSLEQLRKGKAFLEKISRILKIDAWKHFGFVCFPEVESKEAFKKVATDQELKDVLTRAELKSLDEKW